MHKTRYILAGCLIDGSGGEVCRNVFLEVKDGIIAAIGPAADLPRDEAAAADDLSQCTIVPPFVDCSVSLAHSPSVDEKVRLLANEGGSAEKAALVMQHIRYCYSHGVLGVAASDEGRRLSEHVEGPGDKGINIDIRRAGKDFLRIIYSSIVDDEESRNPPLTWDVLGHILDQKGNKKAVVVANGVQQVQEALAAGCDAIEQGYGMGEESLRQMAAKEVLWIPSVLMAKNAMQGSGSGGDVMCRFSMRYVGPGKPDPNAESFWKKMLEEQLAQLRFAKELGVKTAVGSGAGNIGILHGESVAEEIKLFIKAGYSLAEAIRSASVNGAGFFGMDNLGELAAGRVATFLVARGTVQQLPRKLAYLEGMYVRGDARKL